MFDEAQRETLRAEINRILDESVGALMDAGHLESGSVIVLGCSTSEITGARIGKGSVPELGEIVAEAMLAACKGHGVHAAFQCCEHLNRGIVVEKAVLKELGLTQVRAIPQPKAGGSVPAAAWKKMEKPALAVSIQADAAIDIGDTLVGMHIRPAAADFDEPCGTCEFGDGVFAAAVYRRCACGLHGIRAKEDKHAGRA